MLHQSNNLQLILMQGLKLCREELKTLLAIIIVETSQLRKELILLLALLIKIGKLSKENLLKDRDKWWYRIMM